MSCEKALKLDPGSARVHSAKATALFNLGRRAEALESCNRVPKLDPSDRRANYLGNLLSK